MVFSPGRAPASANAARTPRCPDTKQSSISGAARHHSSTPSSRPTSRGASSRPPFSGRHRDDPAASIHQSAGALKPLSPSSPALAAGRCDRCCAAANPFTPSPSPSPSPSSSPARPGRRPRARPARLARGMAPRARARMPSMYNLIKDGDLAGVQRAVQDDPALLDATVTAKKRTPLMWALNPESGGQPAIAQWLVEQGAKLDLQDNYGWTALMWACRYDQPDTAQLLIERGAKLDLQKNEGWTALMLACYQPLESHHTAAGLLRCLKLCYAWI